MSELPAADEALTRGLDLARRLGLAYPMADLRNNQCLVLHARGGVEPALACYREALALYHQLGETKDEATALNNLAVLYRSLGEIDEALVAYGEAREILATLDDHRQEATTLNNLGAAYSTLGEAERARLYLTRALALRQAVEDRRGEIVTLNNLGWLERKSGAAEKAIPLHSQALAVALPTHDARNEGTSRSLLGEAQGLVGRDAKAAIAALESLRARLGNPELRAAFWAPAATSTSCKSTSSCASPPLTPARVSTAPPSKRARMPTPARSSTCCARAAPRSAPASTRRSRRGSATSNAASPSRRTGCSPSSPAARGIRPRARPWRWRASRSGPSYGDGKHKEPEGDEKEGRIEGGGYVISMTIGSNGKRQITFTPDLAGSGSVGGSWTAEDTSGGSAASSREGAATG
jgi:hypothetical protein